MRVVKEPNIVVRLCIINAKLWSQWPRKQHFCYISESDRVSKCWGFVETFGIRHTATGIVVG